LCGFRNGLASALDAALRPVSPTGVPAQEHVMRMSKKGLARIALVTFVFAAGWVGGSASSRTATAEMPGMADAMKAAEGQGGALGSAAKLGTTITDMQSNVENLQKGLDTLKTIQKAIGG
jgi:hypothetical protein